MADENTNPDDDFDIDKLLDDVSEDDKLTQELEALKKQSQELARENERLQKEMENKKDDKEEDDDEGDEKIPPEIADLNKKLQDLETDIALDRQTRIVSGMNELQEKYPTLMTNKEVLDAPLIDGAATTAKEFLESMLAGGNMSAVEKAVEKIALLNGIKLEKTSEALPRGKTPSGEDEPDKELKDKIKNVNEMIRMMRTGKLARKIAKEKGLN